MLELRGLTAGERVEGCREDAKTEDGCGENKNDVQGTYILSLYLQDYIAGA